MPQTVPVRLATNPSIEYQPGVVLVKLKSGVTVQMAPGTARLTSSAPSLANSLRAAGAVDARALFPPQTGAAPGNDAATGNLARIQRLTLAPGADVAAAVAQLAGDPAVEYAEPDYIARAAVMPDDPLFAQQWWATPTHLPLAWDAATGALTVTIAIVDSGIDLDHPDLLDRLWINPGEIAGNGVDDDNNGVVDDVNGWDFIYASNNLQDENGHGTEVAGVAAATGANGQGIAGVCWGCRIMPVRVMQPSGIVNYSDLARGITYAAAKGAHVINLSVGGYANSRTLQTVIQNAAQTAVIIAGAGNDGVATPFYPAAYPEVLAVGAIDESGQRAAFSNFGPWVDLAAPGANMLTTFDGGSWGAAAGTSVAAPVVSGVAGLVKTLHPDWTAQQIAAHLRQTAAALVARAGGELGAGLVDAANAVQPPQPAFAVDGYALNDRAGGAVAPNSTGNQLVMQLRNTWFDAGDVQAQLTSPDRQSSWRATSSIWAGWRPAPASTPRRFCSTWAPQPTTPACPLCSR